MTPVHKLQFRILTTIKPFLVFLFLLLGALLLLSCNGNKAQKQKNYFKVSIDLIAYQESSMQLFYVINADDSYSEDLSLRKNVKASSQLQRLVFELPLGIKAKNIRIDLGENENENDSVQIQNIRFEYKHQVLNGNQGQYKSWFTFNPNVVAGKNKLTFHLKKANGIFDPQLNGNRVLNAKLVKLFPPDVYEK